MFRASAFALRFRVWRLAFRLALYTVTQKRICNARQDENIFIKTIKRSDNAAIAKNGKKW
jgi:hypothetical protein